MAKTKNIKNSQNFTFENKELINDFLNEIGFLKKNEELISITKPGEGNMNFVARIITNQRSFILKQSSNYVQKYPQIAAPIERIFTEISFFKVVRNYESLAMFMPKLLLEDNQNHAIILEDLGESLDFSMIYKDAKLLNFEYIKQLLTFLNKLHSLKPVDFPENREMKALNHEHIFNYPFNENNGLNLDVIQEGLQSLSMQYKHNQALKLKIKILGELFLQNGNTLLHGDFYPGSWLITENGVKIIDPEFSFLGVPEFDIGVFIAHFYLSKNEKFTDEIFKYYEKDKDFDEAIMWSFAGVEIMRRLLGIAQLPIIFTLSEKEILLQKATDFIKF